MRLFQLLCYGIFILSFAQAQPFTDYELPIEERLGAYCQLLRQERFDAAFKYIYPPLFNVVSRADLLEQFRYNAHHPDLTMLLGARRATHFGTPVESLKNVYVRVEFTQDMRVTFKPDAVNDLDFIEATLEMFSQEFGAKQVTYDPVVREIKVKMPKKLVAIRTDSNLEWYFLELTPATFPLLEGLLPKGVRNYLK